MKTFSKLMENFNKFVIRETTTHGYWGGNIENITKIGFIRNDNEFIKVNLCKIQISFTKENDEKRYYIIDYMKKNNSRKSFISYKTVDDNNIKIDEIKQAFINDGFKFENVDNLPPFF